MPVIIKIKETSALNRDAKKKESIFALIDLFSARGASSDFSTSIIRIADQNKIPADLLVKQALGILFGETLYLQSAQYKYCNQGGMMFGAPNWIGDRTVRADTIMPTSAIPPTYAPFFELEGDNTRIEILDSWFRRKNGTYDKYVDKAGGTYPALKQAWMGLLVKLLYLVTPKETTNKAVLAVAPSYQRQLWAPYEAAGVSNEYKAAVYRLAKNTLIYNSQGTVAKIQGYVTLIEGVKKSFSITVK